MEPLHLLRQQADQVGRAVIVLLSGPCPRRDRNRAPRRLPPGTVVKFAVIRVRLPVILRGLFALPSELQFPASFCPADRGIWQMIPIPISARPRWSPSHHYNYGNPIRHRRREIVRPLPRHQALVNICTLSVKGLNEAPSVWLASLWFEGPRASLSVEKANTIWRPRTVVLLSCGHFQVG